MTEPPIIYHDKVGPWAVVTYDTSTPSGPAYEIHIVGLPEGSHFETYNFHNVDIIKKIHDMTVQEAREYLEYYKAAVGNMTDRFLQGR